MTKQLLVDGMAEAMGCSKATAAVGLDSALETIRLGLLDSGSFKVMGFGTFNCRKVEPHTGRNPRTGEAIAVPASVRVAFKAGLDLRRQLAPPAPPAAVAAPKKRRAAA